MNLKHWTKRALVIASVAASLVAAGTAQADSVVATAAPGSAKAPVSMVVATAPRSSTATWWLLVIAGLLVSVGIGLRVVEAWRRVPSLPTAPDPRAKDV